MDDLTTDFKARIGEEVKYLTIRVDRLDAQQSKITEMLQTLLNNQERLTSDLENHTALSTQILDRLVETIDTRLETKLLRHEKRGEQKINQLLIRVITWIFASVILPTAGFFAWKLFEHLQQ